MIRFSDAIYLVPYFIDICFHNILFSLVSSMTLSCRAISNSFSTSFHTSSCASPPYTCSDTGTFDFLTFFFGASVCKTKFKRISIFLLKENALYLVSGSQFHKPATLKTRVPEHYTILQNVQI